MLSVREQEQWQGIVVIVIGEGEGRHCQREGKREALRLRESMMTVHCFQDEGEGKGLLLLERVSVGIVRKGEDEALRLRIRMTMAHYFQSEGEGDGSGEGLSLLLERV